MNIIDIIFILILLFSVVFGAVRGFIREMTGLLAVFLGITLAIALYRQAAPVFTAFLPENPAAIISFLAILVLAAAAVLLAGHVIRKLVHLLLLGWLDHLLGLVFGLLRGLAVCGAVIVLLLKYPVVPGLTKLLTHSSVAQVVTGAITAIGGMIKIEFFRF